MGGHGYEASKPVRLMGEETGLGEMLRPVWDPACAWCPGDVLGEASRRPQDEIIGGHHRLSGHQFEQTKPGVLQSMGSQKVGRD